MNRLKKQETKQRTQEKLRRHFHRHTTLHPSVMGDLTEDQEKLQEAFNDRRLLLRYSYILKCVQIWYESQDGLYIVLNIEDHYNLAWAIWELKRRQKTARELKQWYLDFDEKQEKESNRKNDELGREAADLYFNWKKQRVITSAYTKEN